MLFFNIWNTYLFFILSHIEIADLSGSVEFNHGEITRSADLDLSRVPHAELIAFEIILLQPTGGGKLGPKHKALVNVFGEEGNLLQTYSESINITD